MSLAKVLVSTVSILFSVTFSAGAWAAYDNTWYQTEFWSGEYPNGISVIEEGVTLPARATKDTDLPVTIQCAVPFRANYHPWNSARKAKFFTAAKIIPMTANVEVKLGSEGEEQATVAPGELVEYLIYGAEGTFLVRYKGKEYWSDQDLLEKMTYDVQKMEVPQDEWLNITCTGGENAWIFMRDLTTSDQDGNPTYPKGTDSWFRGFRDYGSVTDLTDEDLKAKP